MKTKVKFPFYVDKLVAMTRKNMVDKKRELITAIQLADNDKRDGWREEIRQEIYDRFSKEFPDLKFYVYIARKTHKVCIFRKLNGFL